MVFQKKNICSEQYVIPKDPRKLPLVTRNSITNDNNSSKFDYTQTSNETQRIAVVILSIFFMFLFCVTAVYHICPNCIGFAKKKNIFNIYNIIL